MMQYHRLTQPMQNSVNFPRDAERLLWPLQAVVLCWDVDDSVTTHRVVLFPSAHSVLTSLHASPSPARPACRCALRSQMSIEAVYHQLAMLRSRLAATAAARTEVSPSEAAEAAQTENALLTLVEANVRVVESQRCDTRCHQRTTGSCQSLLRQ